MPSDPKMTSKLTEDILVLMNYSFYTANELIEVVSTGQNQITGSDDINSNSPDRINLPDEIT